MKDGYNSAHRYYLNVFRDTYRQVLIGGSIMRVVVCECAYIGKPLRDGRVAIKTALKIMIAHFSIDVVLIFNV